MLKKYSDTLYIKHIFVYVLAIEEDYTGPVLENGEVTFKFVQDLLETFKDQKKLHSRFAFQVYKKRWRELYI